MSTSEYRPVCLGGYVSCCGLRWSQKEFGNDGVVYDDDEVSLAVIYGGDKGYVHMRPPGPKGIKALTMTAKQKQKDAITASTENTDKDKKTTPTTNDKKKKAKKSADDQCYFDARFSHHRSAVERVIGWLKQTSRFVAGPIFVKQVNLLNWAVVVTCALSNRSLKKTPKLFRDHSK